MIQAWILAVYYALLGTSWYLFFSVAESHQHPWQGTWRATAVILTFAAMLTLLASAVVTAIFRSYGHALFPGVRLDVMIYIGCGISLIGFVAGLVRAKAYNRRLTLG